MVISQRERTIALRPMGDGLMAHTLYENRDLNSSKDLFDGLAAIKIDPEMVQLATQLVQRQTAQYDAADLDDQYEIRLREMIDAKLKGEGIDVEAEAPVAKDTNVIDLMAALKQSLGQSSARPAGTSPPPVKRKGASGDERQQAALKLPIKGGKERADDAAAQPATRPTRKQA